MALGVEPIGTRVAAPHPLLRLVAVDGSAAHRWVATLREAQGHDAMRNLADAAHFLCMLHGRQPGVIDHAADGAAGAPLGAELARVAEAFGAERSFVTRVAVASGPAPSTPGAAQSEQAVAAQVHALEMLSLSERRGCAAGAALALALDWRAVRPVLSLVAARCGIDPPFCALPDGEDVAAFLDGFDDPPSTERALLFGASQLLAQQRGLLDLLEARADARRVADAF